MLSAIKYISAVIALFATLLFISDVITSLTSDKVYIAKEGEAEPAMRHAAFRLILGAIMAITWPIVFVF